MAPNDATNLLHSADNSLSTGSDMDDNPELEAQLAFVENNINLKRRRSRSIMMRVAMVAIPLLIGVAVVFVVLFGLGGKKPSSKATGAYLPPIPKDLEAFCGKDLSVEQNNMECRELCEPAECCHYPAVFATSCLAGHETQCMTYHASCRNIEGYGSFKPVIAPGSTIPAAPSTLAKMCDPDSLATIDGFGECQAACNRATCCWEGGCPEFGTECEAYAPCLHLGATDHIDESGDDQGVNRIESGVADSCNDLSTFEKRQECRQVCQHSLCCFSNSISCPQGNDFCSQYQLCDQLESTQDFEASAEEIAATCGSDVNLNKYRHESMCEVNCERGECCYNSEITCDDSVDCDGQYGPCAFLYDGISSPTTTTTTGGGSTTTSAGGSIPEQIAEACAGVVAPVNPDGACYQICEDSDCCFDDDQEFDEDCGPEISSCEEYMGCSFVFEEMFNGEGGMSDDVQAMRDTIDSKCQGHSNVEEAKNAGCDTICEPGTCCWDPNIECGEDVLSCRVYDSCYILHAFGEDEDLKQEIDDACVGADANEVDQDFDHPCHKLCHTGACCFDEALDCSAVSSCESYDACSILYESEYQAEGEATEGETLGTSLDDIIGMSPQEVSDACFGDDKTCRALCGQARCCFEPAEACAQGINCDAFEHCSKLFGGIPEVGEGSTTDYEAVEPPENMSTVP